MSSRGLTLIEVLVATTVASLVLLIIGGLYLTLLNIDRRTQAARELGEISVAMDSLTAVLRETSRGSGGLMIWEDSAGGRPRKIIAVTLAGGAGWTYFVHDQGRRELRRVERHDASPVSPGPDAGRVLARNVSSVDVVRRGDLYTVTVVGEKNGQQVRLQTEVWPRNE